MFISLQSCNVYQYCEFTVLRPFNHFNLMSLEYYSFLACILQSKWFEGLDLVGVLAPWNLSLPPTGVVLWIWVLPGNPWKTIKFQACSQYPQISLKVCPRSPKVTKMTPKTLPGDIKFVNKWKTWNVTKTVVFCNVYSTYSHQILASFPSLDQ